MDFCVYSLAMQLLARVPHLLVWAAAIALAVTRLNLHPKASKLLLVGASLSVAGTLFGAGLALLPMYLIKHGTSTSDVGLLTGVMSIGNTLVSAVGMAFVVAAVFVERKPSSRRSAADRA